MSKVLHVLSVIAGIVAIVTALAAILAGTGNGAFGLSREHLLLCSGILFLSAIWFTLSTIHHLMLEEKGRMV